MFAKFWSTIFIALFFLMTANVSFAAPQEISAEGEYRLGDRDSRETAKMAALADAKRKIIEQVGVYVESYSEVNKFQLTQDQIRTAANAMIKLKSEEINFYENGTLCKAFVVATVDTDGENIKRFIETVMPGKTTPQTENNSVDRKKVYGHKNYYWLGGFREMEDLDGWKWITGETFSYTNWGKGEPSNTGGHETLIAVYKYPGLDGIWFDISGGKYNESDSTSFYRIQN